MKTPLATIALVMSCCGCATSTPHPTEINLCALVSSEQRYNNEFVRVSALLSAEPHYHLYLTGDQCSDVLVGMDIPEHLEGNPELRRLSRIILSNEIGPFGSIPVVATGKYVSGKGRGSGHLVLSAIQELHGAAATDSGP